jgi:hypothetical protein
MSADRTTVEVSRAALIFSLDRKEASRLIRDLAAALATEDEIAMEGYIATGWQNLEERLEFRVGVRNSFGFARGPLLYSAVEIPEAR